MKSNRLRSFALVLLLPAALPAISHAAGCCEGLGAFGLEGDWQSKNAQNSEPKVVSLTNASFESSRDLFADLNAAFAKRWQKKTGYVLTVQESHASTETQARSILLGADPDVATFDNAGALDVLAKNGQLPTDWQTRLPDNSAPYTTAVVFVVRHGNPKHLQDWGDLATEGVSVITPDPKLSGRGQWNYLSAWSYAIHRLGSQDKAIAYLSQLYRNVPVLNSSNHGSVETFSKKKTGDVLLLWESEARALVQQFPDLQLVTPPTSLLVEPPVAYFEKNSEKHRNLRVTVSFLKYLYEVEAQEIIAAHHYRPRLAEVAEKHKADFPALQLRTVAEEFGSWSVAANQHFARGGISERVFGPQPGLASLDTSRR